jgi:hypothetical protein
LNWSVPVLVIATWMPPAILVMVPLRLEVARCPCDHEVAGTSSTTATANDAAPYETRTFIG